MHVRFDRGQDGLEGIEDSIGDLVPISLAKKSKVQMAKSRDFGPSLMTEEAIKSLEEERCFLEGKGHLPHGATIPRLEVDEAVMFKDLFCLRPPDPSDLLPSVGLGDLQGTTPSSQEGVWGSVGPGHLLYIL